MQTLYDMCNEKQDQFRFGMFHIFPCRRHEAFQIISVRFCKNQSGEDGRWKLKNERWREVNVLQHTEVPDLKAKKRPVLMKGPARMVSPAYYLPPFSMLNFLETANHFWALPGSSFLP